MKKNIFGILFLLLINSSFLHSQNYKDTTTFYFKSVNVEYNEAIDYCISGFQKWNVENNYRDAVVLIHTSLDENNELILSISQTWKLSIDGYLPDSYSYKNGQPVLWYFGTSILSTPTKEFKDFLLNRFPKVFYSQQKQLKGKQNDIQSKPKDRITLEEWNKLSPLSDSVDSISTKIVFYPSYIVKMSKQHINPRIRRLIIERVEKNIYEIVVTTLP